MPNNLTLPSPDVAIAECPHCGAKVRVDKVWFQKLSEWLRSTNTINADIVAIKAFVGMP